MKWYFAVGENHDVIPHIVSEVLLKPVIDNLNQRGVSDMSYSLIREDEPVSFDLPGMIMADRHMFTIKFDGLAMKIPATDIAPMLAGLDSVRARPEIAESCYKLHGFLRCLCLTAEQKTAFGKALKKVLAEASAITIAENKIFNERLAKAHQHNVLVKPRPIGSSNKGNN